VVVRKGKTKALLYEGNIYFVLIEHAESVQDGSPCLSTSKAD